MKKIQLALILAVVTLALTGSAVAFTPALKAKKGPTQDRILRCQQAFQTSGIQKNGYQAFMKNCLKRKVMPIRP